MQQQNYILYKLLLSTWRIDIFGVVDTFTLCPFGHKTDTLDIFKYLKWEL